MGFRTSFEHFFFWTGSRNQSDRTGSGLEIGPGLEFFWVQLQLRWVQYEASGESNFVLRLNEQVDLTKENLYLQWLQWRIFNRDELIQLGGTKEEFLEFSFKTNSSLFCFCKSACCLQELTCTLLDKCNCLYT